METEKGKKICENPGCKKEFTPATKRAVYCSGSCRANASKIRAGQSLGFAAPTQQVGGFGALGALQQMFMIPPQAQMMIDHHKKESERWEEKYNAQVKKYEEISKEFKDHKDAAASDANP
jgi:hypothetical protein